MTEQTNNEPLEAQEEKQVKKVSLEEAVKRKLAEKKQAQNNAKGSFSNKAQNMTMKSQQTKKQNNQRRRMGV